jgi:PKD repeat protein
VVIDNFTELQKDDVQLMPDGGLELKQDPEYDALESFDIPSAIGDNRNPAIAVDRSGDTVVTWENMLPMTGIDVYAQAFSPDEDKIGTRMFVGLGPGDQCMPALAINSTGGVLVAWSNGTVADGYALQAALFSLRGEPLGPPMNISSNVSAVHPAMAVAPDDSFIIAWKQVGVSGQAGVFAQRLCADGSLNGSQITPLSNSDPYTPPAVGFNSCGEYIIAWDQLRSDGAFDITGQRFAPDGSPKGSRMDICFQDGDQTGPVLAVNSTDGFVVAWKDHSRADLSPDICYQLFAPNETDDGTMQTFPSLAGGAEHPAVAFGPSGELVMAWWWGDELYLQSRDSNGTDIGDVTVVQQSGGTVPVAAVNRRGDVLCAWQQTEGSKADVLGRWLIHPFAASGHVFSGEVKAPPDFMNWSNISAMFVVVEPSRESVNLSYSTPGLGDWMPVPQNGSIMNASESHSLFVMATLSSDNPRRSPVLRSITIGYRSNQAPSVTIPDDFTARRNSTVVLDAHAEDLDNDTLTFCWTMLQGPPVVIEGSDTARLSFVSQFPGIYRFRLQVSDGIARVRPRFVNVTVLNMPPVADLQVPVTDVPTGWNVSFYATGSRDPDGTRLLYKYRFGDGNETAWINESLVEHAYAMEGNYTANLTVMDSDGAGATSPPVIVTVKKGNRDPVITSSPPGNATVGKLWEYDVSATDTDGDTIVLQLAWAPPGMTIDADGRVLWTPAPGQEGIYTLVVVATDGHGGSFGQIFDISVEAAAPVPPTCIITFPAEGARCSGTLLVRGQAAAGASMLVEVEVRVDNGSWLPATGTENWQLELRTRNYHAGRHLMEARAFDGTMYSSNASVNLTFLNEKVIGGGPDVLRSGVVAVLVIVAVCAVAIFVRKRRRS